MANRPLHLENQRFGRLVAKELIGKVGKANLWLCVCDCGNEHKVKANYLKSGVVRSCGCLAVDLNKERSKKHGMRNTIIYRRWQGMKSRCKDPKDPNYGGRGICVDEPWNSDFMSFYNDVVNKY